MPNGAGGDHSAEDGLDRALRVLEEKLAAEAADRAKAAREQAKAREREARRHSRKSNGRVRNRTVVSVVTLALVGAGVLAAQHFGHGAGGPAAPLGQSSGPPADPFASTPADHWASG